MFSSSITLLNGFLNKYDPTTFHSLIEPLSKEIKEKLERRALPIEIDPSLFFRKTILNEVHYSWYIPLIETYEKGDLSFLVHAFNDETKKEIIKYFHLSPLSSPPTSIAIEFFQEHIFNKILDSKIELLPIEYLPESDLNPLLDLSKKELIMLIDYLPLFDLAIEMPKIVDPKILKKINIYLPDNKKKLLKKLSFYKQPFVFPSLLLNKAKNEEDFKLIMHKRGLNRLAIALCNEDRSFIWYICHKLDIGRGKTLNKLSKNKTENEITKTITFNIIELLPIIKDENKKAIS